MIPSKHASLFGIFSRKSELVITDLLNTRLHRQGLFFQCLTWECYLPPPAPFPHLDRPSPLKVTLLAEKIHLFVCLCSLARLKYCPCAYTWFEFRTKSIDFLPLPKPSNFHASFRLNDLFNTEANQNPSCRLRIWSVLQDQGPSKQRAHCASARNKTSMEQVSNGNQVWRVSPSQNTGCQLFLGSDECVT